MRVLPLVTGVLSQLQERQVYDNGQYTVISTVLSYSESYIYSSQWGYGTTTIVTRTAYIPCPTWTSYTTLTTWSCPANCPVDVQTVCYPKSCTEVDGGSTFIKSTDFSAGDTATAVVTGSGIYSTTVILAAQCTTTWAFVGNGNPEGLPTCGGAGPVPPVPVTCIASPCTVTSTSLIQIVSPILSGHTTITSTATFTTISATTYNGDQQAIVAINPPSSIVASSCVTFTSPQDGSFGVSTTGYCGAPVDAGGNGAVLDTCAGSVVTYSYTTSGAEVVETTTLPGRCFSFSGGGHKVETIGTSLVVWLWYGAAILSGVGMIIL